MRKTIALIACLSTTFIGGMEPNSSSIVFNGTIVSIKQGNLYEAYNTVDLVIIAKEQLDIAPRANTPFYYYNTNTPRKGVPTKLINSNYVVNNKIPPNQNYYCTKNTPYLQNYASNTALSIEAATNYVADHYKTILTKGFNKIDKKREKTIALSALNSTSKFPEIVAIVGTAAGIFDFIDDFPDAYSKIKLFVEYQHEIALYVQLLQKSREQLNTK